MSMIGFSRFLSVPTPVCGHQDGAMLEGFIAFVEPVKGRLLRREERLRRCHGQRDHELRDHSLHG